MKQILRSRNSTPKPSIAQEEKEMWRCNVFILVGLVLFESLPEPERREEQCSTESVLRGQNPCMLIDIVANLNGSVVASNSSLHHAPT
jgi:hypothetical protein